jgi:hypothetical protein
MRAKKWLSRLSFIGGLLVVLVGVVHSAVTPMVYRGLSAAIPGKALGAAFFFAVMGLYVMFAGWLMVYSARGLAQGERWAWMLALSNGACNAIAGVGAVAVGFRNPFVWVWFLVALSIALFASALRRLY